MNIIIIKNDTATTKTISGKEFSPGEEFSVPTDGNRAKWVNSDALITAIGANEFLVGDGTRFMSSINDAINWLKGAVPYNTLSMPFAGKSVDGGSIYSRITGNSFSVAVGTTYLELDITYPKVKFTGVEVIGGEVGDKVDLLILDSDTGTYSGVGNTPLNQFGYSVNVAPGFYSRESPYDGDLYYGMTVLIKYTSVSNKTIYPNFIIHEIK